MDKDFEAFIRRVIDQTGSSMALLEEALEKAGDVEGLKMLRETNRMTKNEKLASFGLKPELLS